LTYCIHPAIETLDIVSITKAEAHAFTHNIDDDLKQVNLQLTWHQVYAPVHRCSFALIYSIVSDSAEPWKLMRLVVKIKRKDPGKTAEIRARHVDLWVLSV
jgi:hypothetical protein